MIEQINKIDCNIDGNSNKTLRHIILNYSKNRLILLMAMMFPITRYHHTCFLDHCLVTWSLNKIIFYQQLLTLLWHSNIQSRITEYFNLLGTYNEFQFEWHFLFVFINKLIPWYVSDTSCVDDRTYLPCFTRFSYI